jgi:hypothetical protein
MLFSVGLVEAQKSELDTLRIVASSGSPGETIAVPIWLVNTFDVSAVSFRITYDPRIIEPVGVDAEGGRVKGIYNKFGERFDGDEGWLYWFGLNFDSPSQNYIESGSGASVSFICKVKAEAPVGTQTRIEFEDGEAGQLNALSDRSGKMIVPVLSGGSVQVLSKSGEDRISGGQRLPLNYGLRVSPSPFSDEAVIHYALPGSGSSDRSPLDLSLKIFDINGRMVRDLLSEPSEPGYHMTKWDGRGNSGNELPAGVYFLKMVVRGEHRRIAKLVLVR